MNRVGAAAAQAVPATALLRTTILLATALLLPAALAASPAGPGTFLVAAQGLAHPNFSQTVVLLIDHGEQGSWGLVINRPAPVRLSELLPEERQFRGRKDALLLGGPVSPQRLLVLFRSSHPPADSRPVFDDVHVTGSRETVRRLRGVQRLSLRVYAGYAGWASGQLEAEINRGDWHVMPAEAAVVFAEEPQRVWQLLLGRAPLQVANLSPAAPEGPDDKKAPAPAGAGANTQHKGLSARSQATNES